MEFSLDKIAKEVAEKALNEITYEGKTLREWVEIIVKQQTCEDCISREAVEDITWEEPSYDDALNVLTEVRDKVRALPSVKPNPVFYPPCEDCNTKMDEVRRAYDKLKSLQPCEDYISREQTLKAFAEKCGGECACCEYNGSGYDTAENCKLIKSMPSVKPKTDWIPIDDDLPEEDELVMVTMERDGHRMTTTAVYYPSSLFWHDYVTAWMPYIEPYKGESEDKE